MRNAENKIIGLFILLVAAVAGAGQDVTDPLPSWNDVAVKKAIIAYVTKVTDSSSPDFIPVIDRIATFDNSNRNYKIGKAGAFIRHWSEDFTGSSLGQQTGFRSEGSDNFCISSMN